MVDSVRQHRILIWGGALAALMLLWAFVWDPLSRSRVALRQQLAEHQSTVLWLRQIQPQVIAGSHQQRGLPEGKSLLRLADETLRAGGLAAAIERIEPGPSGEVRVWLRDASFDQLAQWLVLIADNYAVLATQFNASSTAEGGLVNVRLEIS